MNNTCLKLYVHQFQKHSGILLYEWLLKKAKALHIPGGTAYLSLASFGHHGQMHEGHFYELAGGNLTVEVSFVLDEKLTDQFLTLLKKEELKLFYIKFPVESGFLGNH